MNQVLVSIVFFLVPAVAIALYVVLNRRKVSLRDVPLYIVLIISLGIGLYFVIMEGGPAVMKRPGAGTMFAFVMAIVLLVMQIVAAKLFADGQASFFWWLLPPIFYLFVLGPILWQMDNRPDALVIDSVRALVMGLLGWERYNALR